MSPITVLLVIIVAFLAGMEGILDEWEFHQPLVACTLIGLVTGHLDAGIILGGQLQMIALGWANIGAAVAPDAALASVASAIIMVLALNGGGNQQDAITTSMAVAIPLSVAGLFLTMICRTIATAIVHAMDACADKDDMAGIDRWQFIAIAMQGLRIAIPAACLCFIPSEAVTAALNAMPAWLTGGMAVGGGMVAAVGYCMVINMMASKEVWPFFALGFVLAAIKALYKDPEDQKAALKRHLEFYNTHPYVSAPVIGVVLAMEEERANGAPIDDVAIQGVKVGMMGPLAGVGDPVFWYTVRPILGALGASLALSGSIVGPLLFFIAWNIIRIAFLWYTQEAGYNLGTSITKDLSGGLLGRLTEGASILGMFIIGALVERWVSINFTPVVAQIPQQAGAYIDWESLPAGADGIKQVLTMYSSIGATALDPVKTVTLQSNLDQLIPGLAAVGLTLFCCWLLKKKVSPIVIILCLFALGIVGRLLGFL